MMRNYILYSILLVIFYSCLIPPAPHVYNYIPIGYDANYKYNKTNSNIKFPYEGSYSILLKEKNVKLLSSLEIISIPKQKVIRLKQKLINQEKELKIDSVSILFSNKKLRLSKDSLDEDSIFNNEYTIDMKLNDRKWEKIFNLNDTIVIQFFVDEIQYETKYIYDKK